MIAHIWQQLTDKMVDTLKIGHPQGIQYHNNQIRAIQYENMSLQGKIPAKDQKAAVLKSELSSK